MKKPTTKKQIEEEMTCKRLSFNDYSYTYENDRYRFSASTKDPMLEVWDKQHEKDIDSYPGTYQNFDGHKKEFVDMVHHLITSN